MNTVSLRHAIARVAAFVLSAVAASYSIIGLTAIFPGAKFGVIVMALTLECAKVAAACWLRANWQHTRTWIKAYLVCAVAVLMVVTSAGIYGFLAKAHVDAQVTQLEASGEASIASAQLSGQKIAVDSLKRQIDFTSKSIPHPAVWGRTYPQAVVRYQRRMNELQTKLATAETAMTELTVKDARLTVAAKRVDADYGPLRFLATAIYSDASDAHLDATVRWLIGLLMLVFDPLAIILWIASTGAVADAKRKFRDDKGKYLRSPKGRFATTAATYR